MTDIPFEIVYPQAEAVPPPPAPVALAGPASPEAGAPIIEARWASSDETDVVVVTASGHFVLKPDAPPLIGQTIAPFVPTPVPLTPLTPRQLRRALLGIGITAAMVEAQIASDQETMIDWEYSTQFERNHPTVVSLGTALGMSSEQIDTLWRAALAL